MANEGQSSSDVLRDELSGYRSVLLKEIRSHKAFTKITLLTGLGLAALGVVLVFYYSFFGWLLILIGLLRMINTYYDFTRQDELQLSLKELERKFGASSPVK